MEALTQIDFDNQLPRCFARVLLKGETSIRTLSVTSFIEKRIKTAVNFKLKLNVVFMKI
jgi:hypothetical protein